MRVSRLAVRRYSLPLKSKIVFPTTVMTHRQGILICVVSENGCIGYGDAAPLPGFSKEGVADVVEEVDRIRRKIIGQTYNSAESILTGMGALVTLPSLRFALEVALLSALAAEKDIFWPNLIAEMIGSDLKSRGIRKCHLVSRGEQLDETPLDSVKIKVGGRPVAEDWLRVKEYRRKLGPEAAIRLDANRAWTLDEAREFDRLAAELDIEFLEEPLSSSIDYDVYSEYNAIPIGLDESLSHDADPPVQHASVLILKPTLLGGVGACLNWFERCRISDCEIVLSSSFESSVGMLGVLGLSWILGSESKAAGVDTLKYFQSDVLTDNLNDCSNYGDLPFRVVDLQSEFKSIHGA